MRGAGETRERHLLEGRARFFVQSLLLPVSMRIRSWRRPCQAHRTLLPAVLTSIILTWTVQQQHNDTVIISNNYNLDPMHMSTGHNH